MAKILLGNVKGQKGDRGPGVTILGEYESLQALQEAHGNPDEGSMAFVGTDLYAWNGLTWEYIGDVVGEPGTPGQNGAPGTPAGFGKPTAVVDASIGTPAVTITATGPDTAKEFHFAFAGLKGEPGEPAIVEWPIQVNQGGTGATNAELARKNLGVPSNAELALKTDQTDFDDLVNTVNDKENKLTGTVGSTSKPVYLHDGTIEAVSDTIGTSSRPVYINKGEPTAISGSIGSSTKPIYINSSGVITASTGNVGQTDIPVYLKSGTLTACGGVPNATILYNNIEGSTGTITLSDDMSNYSRVDIYTRGSNTSASSSGTSYTYAALLNTTYIPGMSDYLVTSSPGITVSVSMTYGFAYAVSGKTLTPVAHWYTSGGSGWATGGTGANIALIIGWK